MLKLIIFSGIAFASFIVILEFNVDLLGKLLKNKRDLALPVKMQLKSLIKASRNRT